MPAPETQEPNQRSASLFRNGRNQAVRIPREFEMACEKVRITKDGSRLILEPILHKPSLARLLASWGPLEEEFPDVDKGLEPLRDIDL